MRGARHVGRGGLDGRRPDPHPLDGAVDRGELRPQGLRPPRLRAGRRGRRRPAVCGAHRARGRHAVGARAALPRNHLGDGAARDRHGLRVRLDGLSAHVEARRACAAGDARGPGASGPHPARGGRRSRRSRPHPARRRLPLPRPGLRAPRRRPGRRRRRSLGREGALRLPRHPRAGVLAAVRGIRHRDPQRARPRHRADARAAHARDRGRRRVALGGAAARGGRVVPGQRTAARRSPPATTTGRR